MRAAGLSLLALAPAALGCAGNVSGSGGGADAEITATHAVVVVERSTDSVEGVRAEASARFVRAAASSSIDTIMQAVGAALELPARGSCASVNLAPHATTSAAPMPSVELVDVGTVSLEARGVETRLGLRQVPDVTDVLTGVVYARGAEAKLLPSGAPYVLHVAGGPNSLAFDVVALAPSDPLDVSIAGEGPAGTLVARGPSIEVSWTADRTDDVLFADIQPAGVRCVLADPGNRVSSETSAGDGLAHAGVSASLLDDSGSLVVHRVRRVPLLAGGVADGEIRFDFSRALTYVRN
jgi:hypothetical protein